MLDESPLEERESGLVPTGRGWFVLNARDAPWYERDRRGFVCEFEGLEGDAPDFDQLGINITVLRPGEAMAMYHWETEAEAFLVISGEALLVAEGQERPLKQWDFVHCPPKTEHVLVGAGDGPCVLLAMSSRQNQAFGPYGEYTANEIAGKHGASPDETTQDADEADANWPESQPSRYREGWLPD